MAVHEPKDTYDAVPLLDLDARPDQRPGECGQGTVAFHGKIIRWLLSTIAVALVLTLGFAIGPNTYVEANYEPKQDADLATYTGAILKDVQTLYTMESGAPGIAPDVNAPNGKQKITPALRKANENFTTNMTPTEDTSEEVQIKDEEFKPAYVDPSAVIGVVNIALEAWKLVYESRTTVNVRTNWAAATPKMQNGRKVSWHALSGWRLKETTMGMLKTVSSNGLAGCWFPHKLTRYIKGNLGGKGAYLTHVKIIPGDVRTYWPWTLNVDVSVSPPVNVGTRRRPIARLHVVTHYKCCSWITCDRRSVHDILGGDGSYRLGRRNRGGGGRRRRRR